MRQAAVKKLLAIASFCIVTTIYSTAQTFTTLFNFDFTSGVWPVGPLVQGTDGDLYGTTFQGGDCCGTVFRTNLTGDVTTIYSFCSSGDCSDGSIPRWLILATDGNFYGSTANGGVNNNGIIFKLTPVGQLTTVHRFSWADGAVPGGIIEADDGYLYGTTGAGGKSRWCPDCGTVFKIASDGTFSSLFSLCVQPDCEGDGGNPGPLIQGSDGALYDTLGEGGLHGAGAAFRITRSGKYSTLFSFITSKGKQPGGGLVESGGSFYGNTCYGGQYTHGTVFSIAPNKFSRLHSFIPNTEGFCPAEKLLKASDGNFYGTTMEDGPGGAGTIFQITPDGTLITLHGFDGYDGSSPIGPLFQATNGIIYGTTAYGGGNSWGTLFSLDMGLPPFVAFVRDSGRVGAAGGILGQGFRGTTSVSLNGTPAIFTVVSDTYIRATVPAGASSGYVTVTTPSGVLTSNVPFRVIP
ncbi:MAG: hypothetical protein LAO09_10635 [Acidobacteriia bacterium]|nr:hypothetical protein [Terriglobia bacterium]